MTVHKLTEYKEPKLWRTVNSPRDNRTYLLPVDVVNIADHIHVDYHEPNSLGYGGSTLEFPLEDGSIYSVKGPWHTNSGALLNDTSIDVRYLHFTQVTIREVTKEWYTLKHYEKDPETGNLAWVNKPKLIDRPGNVLYEEYEPVLGQFMRGELIAHALVQSIGQSVHLDSKSHGGSSRHFVDVTTRLHPMAKAGI